MTTGIEWCDDTVNPVIGCQRCSPACDHCYAERLASRGLCDAHARATRGGRWTGELVWQDGQLEKLSRWKKPRRVFMGSMTDLGLLLLAGAGIFRRYWKRIWTAMSEAPHHTYLLLTKRPADLRVLIRDSLDGEEAPPWLWVGVTVEDQERADQRIPLLEQIPAAGRFVSAEPLLSAINFDDIPRALFDRRAAIRRMMFLDSPWLSRGEAEHLVAHLFVDWVIVGAETGPKARPMHPDWARSLLDQCIDAGVPFFFKRGSDGSRRLDGMEWNEFPEEVRR